MPMNTGEPQDSGWESGTWLGFAMEIGTDIVMFGQEEGSLSFGVGLGWRGGVGSGIITLDKKACDGLVS